jgi:hypothetical protein
MLLFAFSILYKVTDINEYISWYWDDFNRGYSTIRLILQKMVSYYYGEPYMTIFKKYD